MNYNQRLRLFISSLLVVVFAVACSRARPVATVLEEKLVKDGVLKENSNIEIVDSTSHLRENTYTIKVPKTSLVVNFENEKKGWEKISSSQASLLKRIEIFLPQDISTDDVIIYSGFGETGKSHMYIFIFKQKNCFIIRQNL